MYAQLWVFNKKIVVEDFACNALFIQKNHLLKMKRHFGNLENGVDRLAITSCVFAWGKLPRSESYRAEGVKEKMKALATNCHLAMHADGTLLFGLQGALILS